MGLYNNVPTFTYVSATGITVTYNKEVYTVQSFYTNKKYIYWDSDNATVLQASNTMPVRSFKRHLVLINDNGVVKEVPPTHEGFSITYSGDSTEAIKSKIYALYESNKEFGDKFIAIEQDIDGIRQIIGSGGNGGNGSVGNEVVDRVSKLEQTADKIELSVEEVKKVYSDDKEMNLLREELNSAIINLNTTLGDLSSEMSDYYKDDTISSEEKIKIDTGIEIIISRKSELLNHVNKVLLVCEEQGENGNLIALNSSISALENSHENLINNINVAVSDFIITPSEKTVIIDGFAKYNLRINELKNICDEIIFLGVGGIVSERLAQISVKSEEIKLSVNKVESRFTSDLSLQKIELQGQISDVSSSLKGFQDTVETSFRDGIIDETEKKILKERIEQLEKEKLDVDTKYSDIYSNQYLIEPYKTNLKDKYDDYTSKHEELKTKTLEVIEMEKITDVDMINIKTLFNNYSSSLAVFSSYLNTSLDVITTGKTNEELLKVKGEVLKELEETNSKIDDVINNIDEYVGDGIVDSMEKKAIESTLQNLEKEKSDIDAQYNYWYTSKYLKEPLKSEYEEVYSNYIEKYNYSVGVISSIINKEELVSDKDREDMLNAHKDLTATIVIFVEKSNEVISHVSLNQAEDIKNTVQDEINDINDRLDNLDITFNETFKDNIIDQTERKILAQNILDLELQKADVLNQYQQLYMSTYLDGTLKEEFRSAYNNFTTKYTSLIDAINLVLDKVELINDSDRELVSNCQLNLNTAFGEFVKKANEVIEYISKKQSDENIKDFSSELKDLNDKVDGILDDVGGALTDDVLDQAERLILENSLNDLEVQKNDVVVQYENIFNNKNLTDETIKENLKNSYDDFILKYNALVNNIRYLLDKAGYITEENRVEYTTAYTEYKGSVSLFSDNFYIANDYITNKVISDMKNSFNNEIADLNNAITDLDNTMNGIFKDGILSEAEKMSIRQQLFVLEREKQDVDANHNNVYSDTNLSQSLKTSLGESYNSYISSYNQLVNTINSILNKEGIISTAEQSAYRNALNSYKLVLATYSSTFRSAVDNITVNKIATSKSELKKEMDDIITSIENLETNMEEIFKDGILSEAEKISIKQHLYTLYKEKQDIEKQFSSLYASPFLVDTDKIKAKSELKEAYDNFTDMYEVLVLTIDEILRKTTIVDSDDRGKLEEDLVNYRNASAEYQSKAMNAIDCIAGQKAESESEKVNQKYAEILLSEDGIVNRVGNVEKNIVTNTESIIESKEQIAELKLSAESISQRVSNTETTSISLQDQINAQATQITTTNSKVSTIEANLSNITQRVSHTEEVNTNLQSNVNTLNTRVEEAESKITKESITNTVKESFYTKDDIEDKGYATQSQVQQTVNSLEIKFTESGGYNLIYNGDFKNGLESWISDTPNEHVWSAIDGLSCTNGRGATCRGELEKARVIRQQGIELESNIEAFTLSYYIYTSSDGEDGTTNPYRSIEISVAYTDGGDKTYHSAGQQTTFDKWEKHVVTIERPQGRSFASFNIGLWVRDTTRRIYFSQVMVEVGSLATKYSQNPNEIYDGVTTITKDGIKVQMSDGEGEQGYSCLSYDGLSVYDKNGSRKAWFGQGDTSYIEKLFTDDVICDRVVKEGVDRPLTFYVNANPPSNSNENGESIENACSSINDLLAKIKTNYGKYSDWKNITIEVASGSYYEDIGIMGWLGCGQIIIKLNPSAKIYGRWRIYDNTMMTLIKGGKDSIDTNVGAELILNNENLGCLFYIRNCHCSIEGVRAINKCRPSSNGSKYGGSFVQGECANIHITTCDISRFSYGLRADKTCIGNLVNTRGYTHNASISRYGSRVGMAGVPEEIEVSWQDWGGQIYKANNNKYPSLYDPNYESTTPPTTPPTTTPTVFTQSFTVTNLKSIPEGSGSSTSSRSGVMGQGKWSSYKPHRGWGDIPSSLVSFCKGATNISMSLIIRRQNTEHGQYGAVPVPKFVYSGGTWSSGVAFAIGNTKTLTLPSTIVSEISSGSMTKLQMWAGTSTNDYSFYDSAIIKVTCTKNV